MSLPHEFDSSQTCNYCGIVEERTKLGDHCPKRIDTPRPKKQQTSPDDPRVDQLMKSPKIGGLLRLLQQTIFVASARLSERGRDMTFQEAKNAADSIDRLERLLLAAVIEELTQR